MFYYLKKITCALLFSFLIISCQSNKTLYQNYLEVPSGIWDKNTALLFSYKNTQSIEKANIIAKIRYSSAYNYNGLPLQLQTTIPHNPIVQTHQIYIPIFDTLTGNNLGEGMGDTWDLKYPIFENVTMTDTGTYTFKIEQQTPLQNLPFVVDVGLKIEKK